MDEWMYGWIDGLTILGRKKFQNRPLTDQRMRHTSQIAIPFHNTESLCKCGIERFSS